VSKVGIKFYHIVFTMLKGSSDIFSLTDISFPEKIKRSFIKLQCLSILVLVRLETISDSLR